MASVILGDWTHRRGDAGGARAVPAEIDRPRPAVAWSWRPEHGGGGGPGRGGGAAGALPAPVPVAAMVVDDGVVHVVSTRGGEPIFWYALTPSELVPCHRRIVAVADGLQHDDVLDAWATPDGGLWLELDAGP